MLVRGNVKNKKANDLSQNMHDSATWLTIIKMGNAAMTLTTKTSKRYRV